MTFQTTACQREYQQNMGDMFLVFHCIHTSMPISEICRHENLLCKVNTCLTIHHWQGNETNIGTLGFFVNIDPANYLHNKFKEHLHQKISKHNHIDKKKILLFKCGYSSPFMIDSEGYQTSIKAYNIQCCHQDAPQMIKYLRTAYLSSPMFRLSQTATPRCHGLLQCNLQTKFISCKTAESFPSLAYQNQ